PGADYADWIFTLHPQSNLPQSADNSLWVTEPGVPWPGSSSNVPQIEEQVDPNPLKNYFLGYDGTTLWVLDNTDTLSTVAYKLTSAGQVQFQLLPQKSNVLQVYQDSSGTIYELLGDGKLYAYAPTANPLSNPAYPSLAGQSIKVGDLSGTFAGPGGI